MSIDKSKVVLFLATLNGASYLPAQLRSYRDQSHSNWELVVSDDGSTDQTVELINDFARSVPQRVTLLQGPRQGFWRNFLSLVRRGDIEGDFFAFSDQDDVWSAEKLTKALVWLEGNSKGGPALYFTRTILVAKDGELLGCSPLFTRQPSFQNSLVQNIASGNTMVFNHAAKLLLAQTPADIKLVSHDWWAYQMLTGAGGVAYYDAWPSTEYRQHEKNLMGSNAGLAARLLRFRAFARGRFARWNDTNILALNQMRHLLSPANVDILDRFEVARKSFIPKRPYLLWKSGVYRQFALDNIALFVGSLFGRI